MGHRRYVFLGSNTGAEDGKWCAPNWRNESILQASCFHVYEVSLWEDLDSSAVETHGKYNVQHGTVWTDNAENNRDALKSCGWCLDESGNIVYDGQELAKVGTAQWKFMMIDCLWNYGCKEVDGDESWNNLRKLVQRARMKD